MTLLSCACTDMQKHSFWRKVDVRGGDDCWEWRASKNKDGYGQLGVIHGSRLAHRISWELHNGPIPNNLRVLHKCDNPGCVNPAHLFLGTQQDNVADCLAKGRARYHNANKTHCKRGHMFTPENTRVRKDGKRNCKQCALLYNKPSNNVGGLGQV